jgi:hypothetical protein
MFRKNVPPPSSVNRLSKQAPSRAHSYQTSWCHTRGGAVFLSLEPHRSHNVDAVTQRWLVRRGLGVEASVTHAIPHFYSHEDKPHVIFNPVQKYIRNAYSILASKPVGRGWMHAAAQLVEALCYKPEGRGFDSR